MAAVVAGLIALLSGGGGSSSTPSPTAGSVAGQVLVRAKQIDYPARGYAYRLRLWTDRTAPGTPAATREPYFLVFSVRRNGGPFMVVDRKQLPFPFTASSVITQFTLDRTKDGFGSVGLSWYVKSGDTSDQTHYFTLLPTAIQIDS